MRALRVMVLRLAASLRAIGGSRRGDTDVRAELESHLELHIEDNLRRGMSPEAARREALLAAGGTTLGEESIRERRGLPALENLASDVRYALRALRAKPGFSIAVVLTLALGIGANAAMFTIVNAVLLRPLPYPASDRIVAPSVSEKGEDMEVADEQDYFAWVGGARSMTLAASGPANDVVVTASGPEDVRGTEATASYFEVYAAHPLLGRIYTASEDRPTGPRVVVVSESLWRRGFDADSGLIGRSIDIDGTPTTVIGVMPASFAAAQRADFWLPFGIAPSANGTTRFYFAAGRLHDGVTIEAARAELTAISARVDAARPAAQRGMTAVVMTLHERRFGDRRKPLLLLLAAVGVLLLIACANLANLSLARAAGRRREMAVRLALGAGPWRLVRTILCESILLSIAGALLGLGMAAAAVRWVVRLSPVAVGRVEGIHPDWRVLVVTLVVAVATGIAFGLVPALAAARGDLNEALSSGSPRATDGRGRRVGRGALVVAQLATALVLLTAAGLLAHTLWNVASIDVGFRPDRLITARIGLPRARYLNSAGPFFDELIARTRAIPGVESAAIADVPPLGGVRMATCDQHCGVRGPLTDVLAVGPDYFRTLGVNLRAGRVIDETDRGVGQPVMVVNEKLAHQLYANGNAVGKTKTSNGKTTLIVGVVKNALQRDLETTASPIMYLPLAQLGVSPSEALAVRLSPTASAASVEATIGRTVQSIDHTLAPPTFEDMNAVVAESIAPRRFSFVLLGAFAALAAALAVLGLYGVLAHLVADRTREIGIRVALGAEAGRVTRLVLGEGAVLALTGVAIGVAASSVTVRAARTLVYGTSVYDPWTFAGAAVMLTLVSLAASYLPARRASRVDPLIALRAE